jgi:hypothetical protein
VNSSHSSDTTLTLQTWRTLFASMSATSIRPGAETFALKRMDVHLRPVGLGLHPDSAPFAQRRRGLERFLPLHRPFGLGDRDLRTLGVGDDAEGLP